MANPVYPPGPRMNALYGVGGELLDLSAADKTWNPATERSPIQIQVEAETELHYKGYDGTEHTITLPAGGVLSVAVLTVFEDSTPNTGIHAIY